MTQALDKTTSGRDLRQILKLQSHILSWESLQNASCKTPLGEKTSHFEGHVSAFLGPNGGLNRNEPIKSDFLEETTSFVIVSSCSIQGSFYQVLPGFASRFPLLPRIMATGSTEV